MKSHNTNTSVKYLNSIFPYVDTEDELECCISDGVILSKLVLILAPQARIKIDTRDQLFCWASNVENFTDYCKKVKIPEQYIPSPTDVVNKKALAIKDIEVCLWIIAKLSKVGTWESEDKEINLNGILIDEVSLEQQQDEIKQIEKSIEEEKEAPEPEGPVERSAKHKKEKKPSDKKGKSSKPKDSSENGKKEEQKEELPVVQEEEQENEHLEQLSLVQERELERLEQKKCYEKEDMTILQFAAPKRALPGYICHAIVAGAKGVGKTTLCMRIHTGKAVFNREDVPAVFERTYLHEVDHEPANLHLELKISNAPEDIAESHFLFLCFSFSDLDSFKIVPKYLKLAKELNVDVILLGLKADNKTANITLDMIKQIIGKYGNSMNSFMYHSLSPLMGYGIIGLLNSLEFYTHRVIKG